MKQFGQQPGKGNFSILKCLKVLMMDSGNTGSFSSSVESIFGCSMEPDKRFLR